MSEFQQYRKISKPAELRPYVKGEPLVGVSISDGVTAQDGDYIARDPENHADQWLVKADYFARNFEAV
jgi:hypothetical protein